MKKNETDGRGFSVFPTTRYPLPAIRHPLPAIRSLPPEGERVLDAEVLVDPPRGVGFVQGVEVDAPGVVVEQVEALLGRPGDPEPGDALVVTRIDRLARSLRDLQNIVHELKQKLFCHQ